MVVDLQATFHLTFCTSPKMLSATLLWLGFLLLVPQVSSQLIGPVGATTPLHEKTRLCNILDFDGIADNNTDVAPAITAAFEKCVKRQPRSRLVVPEGNYLLKQSIVLSNGTNWAFQLDGLITAEYVGNSTGTSNFLVPRDLILDGFAGIQALNSTINGEGDGKFLENLIVIVNGLYRLDWSRV
jgi:rhamnogalacturonan hydrolase